MKVGVTHAWNSLTAPKTDGKEGSNVRAALKATSGSQGAPSGMPKSPRIGRCLRAEKENMRTLSKSKRGFMGLYGRALLKEEGGKGARMIIAKG